MLSTQIQPEWIKVDGVSFARHEKADKPPTLRVTYRCGLSSHREWLSFEGAGFPRAKAVRWWRARTNLPVPMTVDEALAAAHHLRRPEEIGIKPAGKYTDIVEYRL